MEKIVAQGLLYDFYGELLTARQRKVYEDFVYHDLTLSEIAEDYAISRQAAHDMIRRCDRVLQSYEAKLGLVGRFMRIREKIESLRQAMPDTIAAVAVQSAAGGLDTTILTERVNEITDDILKELLC